MKPELVEVTNAELDVVAAGAAGGPAFPGVSAGVTVPVLREAVLLRIVDPVPGSGD
jgi:hypothetical protein